MTSSQLNCHDFFLKKKIRFFRRYTRDSIKKKFSENLYEKFLGLLMEKLSGLLPKKTSHFFPRKISWLSRRNFCYLYFLFPIFWNFISKFSEIHKFSLNFFLGTFSISIFKTYSGEVTNTSSAIKEKFFCFFFYFKISFKSIHGAIFLILLWTSTRSLLTNLSEK